MSSHLVSELVLGSYVITLRHHWWELSLNGHGEWRYRVVVQRITSHGGNNTGVTTVDRTEPVTTLAEAEEAYQRICTEYAVALARNVLGV